MAVDLTKHDVAINSVGYRLGAYAKAEATTFVPRFNTGSEAENHLDFWKERSINDFRGGAFQIKDDDPTKSYFIVGKPDQRQGKLNSVPNQAAIGSYTNTKKMSAWCMFKGDIYFCSDSNAGASSASTFWKLAASNDATSNPAGFPAALSTNNYITDMVCFEDKIYFASKTGNVQQWDGTTWTAHATRLERLCIFRDTLYGIAEDGGFHSLSGTTWSLVKRFGEKDSVANDPTKMVEMNGRLYIGKPEGLYAYDGVQVVRVLDTSRTQNTKNFKYMAVHLGWLYYNVANIIYRYNGATVEKLFQDDGLNLWDMLSAGDDLYIFATVASLYPYTGFGNISSASYLYPYVLRFDGVGFTTVSRSTVDISAGDSWKLMYQSRKLYIESADVGVADTIKKISVDTDSSNAHTLSYISSEFTMGLPEVQKYLHKLDLLFTKSGSGTPTINVSLVSLEKGYTLTLPASTSLATSYNLYENYGGLYDDMNYSDVRWQIVIEASIASGSSLQLVDISLRHSINPDYRNKWSLNLLCYGTTNSPLKLKDGTDETVTAPALRENLYDARRQNQPVEFVDIDYGLLNGAHNNSVTTITVDNLDTFPESGIVLIGTEKIKYTSRSTTQLLGCTRGYLGTSAASHSDQDKVYSVYLTAITRIVNERVILDPTNVSSNKYVSEVQIELEQAS